jgi:predicted ATPase
VTTQPATPQRSVDLAKRLPDHRQRHNLPLRLTSFVGRTQALAELEELLQKHRVVTLVGGPGVGKTRLALAMGHQLLAEYPDGVWVTELAPLPEAALVPHVVAATLRVTEQAGRPLVDTLAEYLTPKQLLLVVDNCEHLIEAAATLAASLLASCPRLSILATSREPLAIEGEAIWRVPSLAQPDPVALLALDELMAIESVRLFIERARTVESSFALTDQNRTAVAEICRRLDGIPLAIELAAARTNVLTAEQIAARLADRFGLLAAGPRGTLPHQQTLRASIDWSYDLLNPEERRLLPRLAIFAGGCTLDAVAAVCADDELHANTMLDLLAGLVDKSLVLVTAWEGESRYWLLESLRQYGLEKLKAARETALLQRRQAEWSL